jgi:hypothetical protein
MLDTMNRYLAGFREVRWVHALRACLIPIGDRMSSQALTPAGLVVGTTDTTTAKIGAAAFQACANGRMVTIAAGTELPKPLGLNVTTGFFGIGCWFTDSAGTVTFAPGPNGTTAGSAGFPQFPRGQALIGFITVTISGSYIGGTTPLSGATTAYFSPTGAFDPTILV